MKSSTEKDALILHQLLLDKVAQCALDGELIDVNKVPDEHLQLLLKLFDENMNWK